MKLKPLRRAREELPQQTAEQMLANVFLACGREPNSVPLEALSSYSNYRKERYSIQRSVIAVVLLLFMLLPLLFMAAKIDVKISNPDAGENPVYTVSVDALLPIRQIYAEMEGRSVPIYEVLANEFMIQPRNNGGMEIFVTLLNRQESEAGLTVDSVDMDAPVLLGSDSDDVHVYLFLEDAGSGVDYEAVSATAPDGSVQRPLAWDVSAGCITLAYPESALSLRIPDLRGNVLQIALKPEG